MINWRNAKLHIAGMTMEEKRRLYKCREQYKTINDIINWGEYVRTGEGKAKLASLAGNDSNQKDVKTRTDQKKDVKTQTASPVSEKRQRKNTDEDDRDAASNVKDSTGMEGLTETMTIDESKTADKLVEPEDIDKMADIDESKAVDELIEPENIDKMADIDESKAADKLVEPEDTDKMADIDESKDADKPTTGDPAQKELSEKPCAHESKAEDESMKPEDTEKIDVADGDGIEDVDKPTTSGTAKRELEVTPATSTDEGPSSDSSLTDEDAQLDTEKKYQKNDVLNGKVSLFTGDITHLEIDAIVNAANEELYAGGGVDGAIHDAAGYALLRSECDELDGCETGDAKMTSGFKLPAKYIIHAVGPKGEYPRLLRGCYNRAMDLLKEYKLETIAFPCISTGIYGYPNRNAANVALETIRKWLEEDEYSVNVKRVIFCLFMKSDIKIYHELMPKYFPFE